MIVARSESQLDQRSRIRNGLVLPAIVLLKTPHGVLAGLIPFARGFSAQVMLPNQGLLNLLRPNGIDLHLPAHARSFSPL